VNWVAFDEARVLADFPTDLKGEYDAWIVVYPDKAGRLADIISSTVEEFRDAITSNPANILDADPGKIPESCVRSAETIVFYQLMMEMGTEMTAEAHQSMTRAEMFLRMVAYNHFTTTSDEAGAGPTPRYVAGTTREERAFP